MENAKLSLVAEASTVRIMIEDHATGFPVLELTIPKMALGHLLMSDTIDAAMKRFSAPNEPTIKETMLQTIEAPMLPADRDSRDAVVASILRPWEVQGWKGNASHVGDPARVERVLPDGRRLYRVEFVRYVPESWRKPAAAG